jgi:hypothetical protein
MGGGTFDPGKYRAYTSTTTGKTTAEVFTSRSIKAALDPKGVKVRESRDSADNPAATPIIVALDVTGSMGIVADTIARKGLGILFEAILARKPVTNPHLMFMAVGDVTVDRSPLQVSQFEADNRIVEQLTDIYIEGGGGGNGHESYEFSWYFAAKHTVHDSLIKRGKRGYLFTVGDEPIGSGLKKGQIQQFLEDSPERDYSTKECLEEAQRMYDCYHVVLMDAGVAASSPDSVLKTWKPLMGEHLIQLKDHTKLAETIVSIMEVAEGRDAATSAAGWGTSGHVVLDAVKTLPKAAPAHKLLGAV